jgi:hypothetical protein
MSSGTQSPAGGEAAVVGPVAAPNDVRASFVLVAHLHTSNRPLGSWTRKRLRLGMISSTVLLQTAAPHPLSVKLEKERYKNLMA